MPYIDIPNYVPHEIHGHGLIAPSATLSAQTGQEDIFLGEKHYFTRRDNSLCSERFCTFVKSGKV